MRISVIIICILTVNNVLAQPGPFGGFNMSFKLIDKTTNTLVDNQNANYKIYPTHYFEDRYEVVDTFKYDNKTKSFYYPFFSTPVGAAIPAQFAVNVIYNNDTMKIYFAESILGDTLHFEKGEFIATDQYSITKSIRTFNSVKILNNSIYDYEISKLSKLPYYQIADKDELDITTNIPPAVFKAIELPNRNILSFGVVSYNKPRGYPSDKEINGSSWSYNFRTGDYIIEDNGLIMNDINTSSNNYKFNIITNNTNFERIDTLLGKIKKKFTLNDSIFKSFFPNGLNWKDINSLTFSALSNLQIIKDSILAITLNQNNIEKKIFISKDGGIKWDKVFSIKSTSYLNLRIINKNELMAFIGSELYHSKDIGKTWSKIYLKNTSLIITDLIIANDTTGFLLSQTNPYELYRFNQKTGTCNKLLGNLRYFTFNEQLKQRATGFFYYNNSIILLSGNFFIVSKDLGTTWQIINNDCTRILKNSLLWTWYQCTEKASFDAMGYGHYYPSYYRCDKMYNIKSILLTRDNQLNVLCYYNNNDYVSPHLIGEIKFYGLK